MFVKSAMMDLSGVIPCLEEAIQLTKKLKVCPMKKLQIDTSFAGLLGNDPTAKVLEFLIIGRQHRYHISELARKTKVSRPTTYKIIRRMITQGLVISADKLFGIKYYRLNMNSPQVKIFVRCFKSIIKGD